MKKWSCPTLRKMTSLELTSLIKAFARSYVCEECYFR